MHLSESHLIVRQNSLDESVKEQMVSVDKGDEMPTNICFGFFNANDAFLVCNSPFSIYFLTEGAHIIKLDLEDAGQLE